MNYIDRGDTITFTDSNGKTYRDAIVMDINAKIERGRITSFLYVLDSEENRSFEINMNEVVLLENE